MLLLQHFFAEESPSDEEYTDGITKEELRAQIEGWMENKFGLNIDFDPNDCISFLEDVGILSKTQEGMARNMCYFIYVVEPVFSDDGKNITVFL